MIKQYRFEQSETTFSSLDEFTPPKMPSYPTVLKSTSLILTASKFAKSELEIID